MRRLLALAAPILFLVSCSPQTTGPTAPIALEQATPAPALAGGAARQTVIEFVEAYAAASGDGGAALHELVTGDELENWVRWLGVQNAQFPGRVEGISDVRSVAFLGTTKTERALGAQVNLGASIRFSYSPAQGDPFDRTRFLDGAVTLVSLAPGDWRVLDLTRDGVPMSDGIEIFSDEVRTEGDILVRLDSLFMFTPNWQFNVVVENRSSDEIRLDPEGTALFVRTGAGEFERVDGAISPALARIPGGTGVQSPLSFPLQDSADGRVLLLTFRRDGKVYQLDFPLEDLVTTVPPPPPTGEVQEPVSA
jgi:hypothetical protein